MLNLDPLQLSLLVTCLYILIFGGLNYLRREGLSVQFALESIAVAAVLIGGSLLLGLRLSPLLLLIVLYVVTMRSRWIVDLANLFAQRGRFQQAFRLYALGLAWWPDRASRLIVLANRGAAELYSGQVDAAIQTLEGLVLPDQGVRLGPKYEAACHYNLGYAYEKKGEDGKAVAQYNETIDLLPGSLYAKAAQSALNRRKQKGSES
jgi:tetratricopeptide (TPR) repeat protein